MNIWEQNIKEWYDKSGTSRLNYLDLALIEKPSSKELAHNISVVYDRVCLSSKVNLKEFRSQQLQILSLEGSVQQLTHKVEKLEKGINSLTQVCLENQSSGSTKIQLKPIEALIQVSTKSKNLSCYATRRTHTTITVSAFGPLD